MRDPEPVWSLPRQSSGAVPGQPTVAARRSAFRSMHAEGCFLIPNPYDIGGARCLERLGFEALATTTAGVAWGLGLPDGAVTLEAMLDHIRAIVEATRVPVNADFGNGFADEPEGVAENVRLCIATGVAGLSIEDINDARGLYHLDLAVERIRAARSAADAAGGDTILVARSEAYLIGHPDAYRQSCIRLERFAEAGADCLYAPGVTAPNEIAAMVALASPLPVNVLAGGAIGLRVLDLAGLGVRRVSVGGALARLAIGAVMRAAREIMEDGRFDRLGEGPSYSDANAFFAADLAERGR